MSLWVQVTGFVDQELIVEDVMNRPVGQLRERTDYLYNRLETALGSGEFQSLRLPDVPLTSNTVTAPEVGDWVYLNPDTHTYEKALASVSVVSSVFQTATTAAYSMGLLVSRTGTTGTVVIAGKAELSTLGLNWALQDMLEEGDVYQNGPFYLSSSEAGKMTTEPHGIAIYLGYFADNPDNRGTGGYVLVSPQYKDVGEAHMHRAFPLSCQPAGSQETVGTDPTDFVHHVRGFKPTSSSAAYHGMHTGANGATILVDSMAGFTLANYIGLTIRNVTKGTESIITNNDTDEISTVDNIVWDTNDQYWIQERARLVLKGNYIGTGTTTYTLSLTDVSGIAAAGGNAPFNGVDGFENVYLKWVSSDPTEGEGLERIVSYETPIPFGDKGMVATFENALEDAAAPQWTWMESANESIARRQWVIDVPEHTKGWVARRVRQFCTNHQTTDQKFSLLLFGGPYENPNSRLEDTLTIISGKLYRVAYAANPLSGDTITIGSTVYEFDEDGLTSDPDYIPVVIATSDYDETYQNFVDAVVEYGAQDVHVANDKTNGRVIVRVPTADAVALSGGYTGAVLTPISTGVTKELDGGDKPDLLVYNKDYEAMVTGDSYWDDATFFTPVTLTNGLKLMFIPYDEDGTELTDDDIEDADYWDTAIVDEAPGAVFEYNIGMEASLRQFYPSIPFSTVTIDMNGVTVESSAIHSDDVAVYTPGYRTLFWLDNSYAAQPWPTDWESPAAPGDIPVYGTLYLVHMKVNDTSTVTSLQPAPGSPIRVYRCGTTDPATTGDLALDLSLNLDERNANLMDYLAVKRVQGTTLEQGPVVSRIIPGPGVDVSSPLGTPTGSGEVTVSVSEQQNYAGDFRDIAFLNAKQQKVGFFPYVQLLDWTAGGSNNRPSGFVAKFQIPHTIEGTYQVMLYMTVFGEDDIPDGNPVQYAGLQFSYAVLRDYSPSDDTYGTLKDNLIAPASVRNVEIPFGDAAGIAYSDGDRTYKGFDPMVIHCNPNDTANEPARIVRALGGLFPESGDLKGGVPETTLSYLTAQPGSMIAIEIQRADPVTTPAYSGKIGFMNIRWRLARVT